MKTILLSISLMLILSITSFSQNGLTINQSQNQSQYSISEITKLTFSSDSLFVFFTDNSYSSYLLSEVNNILFEDLLTTSLKTNNKESNIKIYPIPTNNELNIEFSSNENQKLICEIYSIDGKKVSSDSKEVIEGDNKLNFNLGSLKNGIYILNIKTNNDSKSYRIVKS